ncbi:hypothetical protein [Aeromonas salmonicida]|uniref:hypothetical protein n=1 Tax=Aeromonas salmonicida TaxID=645 RepID=UPI00223EF371|nr:hypothetical protein [Aeromonas salmonicida]
MEVKISGTVLSIIAPITASVIGGVFYLGLSINSARVEHLKEIVDEYKLSSQLDAPGLITSIRQSANALTLSATERKSLYDAHVRVDEYAQRIGMCEGKLNGYESEIIQIKENLSRSQSQCSETVRALKSELNSYLSDSSVITATKGIATELIPNKFMLGIQSIYDSRAVININKETIFINVGESTKITTSERRCDLWLQSVNTSEGVTTFKLNCPIQG